jgi:hypothetical protein
MVDHQRLEDIVFIQVIEGQTSDAATLRSAIDRWALEIAPGATDWLGTTAGVTEDGTFVALVRFESADAAGRNSSRPEQDEWWSAVAKLFTAPPTFRESSDVIVDLVGDPDQAGFVQVMKGQGSDPDRARELMAQDSDEWAAFRPDILGSVGAQFEGGTYTMAIYFTNEEEAREGERKEPPLALKAQMDEMNQLGIGVPEFFDLKQPWLYSPR